MAKICTQGTRVVSKDTMWWEKIPQTVKTKIYNKNLKHLTRQQ
jgi:hypothetical protein